MVIAAPKRKTLGSILLAVLASTIALSVLIALIANPLVLLIPVVVVALVFFIAHPEAGCYLLVLVLPFQRLEVTIGSVGVSPVDVVVWPWLLACGIRVLLSKRGSRKDPLLIFVALWLLATLVSGAAASHKTTFVVALASNAISAMTLIASYSVLSGRPGVLRAITNLYIAVAMFAALFGGLQLVGLVPNPVVAPLSGQLIGGDSMRMGSFLSNANLLAGYLSVALFFSWMMYGQTSGGRRMKYTAALILLMAAILLTFSRAGFLGIAVGAMIPYVAGSRGMLGGKLFRLAIGALVAITLLAVSLAVYSMSVRGGTRTLEALLTGDTSGFDSSSRKRLIFWEMAANMFESSPLFGVGAGQFQIQFGNFVPQQYSSLEVVNAHSTYLQILAESGLLGLATFLALFGHVAFTGLRARGTATALGRGVKGALAGLVALLVIGLTHNMLRTEIWFVGGLVMAYARQYQSKQEAPGLQRSGQSGFEPAQA